LTKCDNGFYYKNWIYHNQALSPVHGTSKPKANYSDFLSKINYSWQVSLTEVFFIVWVSPLPKMVDVYASFHTEHSPVAKYQTSDCEFYLSNTLN